MPDDPTAPQLDPGDDDGWLDVQVKQRDGTTRAVRLDVLVACERYVARTPTTPEDHEWLTVAKAWAAELLGCEVSGHVGVQLARAVTDRAKKLMAAGGRAVNTFPPADEVDALLGTLNVPTDDEWREAVGVLTTALHEMAQSDPTVRAVVESLVTDLNELAEPLAAVIAMAQPPTPKELPGDGS